MDNTKPSQDERIMAALAHGSAVLFGMGAIAAVVLWATQKEKSRYVAFQALQALVYQIAGFVLYLVGMCCWMGLYFASFIPLMAAAEEGSSSGMPAFFVISLVLMVVPFAQMGLWMIGGLWGAARGLQGREFRYLVIGPWLERQLTD